MLTKFLDPQNDVAFKKIFGSPKNKNILIHFLNDMLTFKEGGPIKDVFFLKTNLDPDIAAQKTSLVDILCKDEKGNTYIVEMQVVKERGFEKRAQYYAAKAYCSQMNEGDKYDNLKEVIFLAISNDPLFKNKKHYQSNHATLDLETYEHDLKGFHFSFLDLSKFEKKIDKLSNIKEKWCYFLKYAKDTSPDQVKKIIGQDKILAKAYGELEAHSWNEIELRTYEQAEKYEWAHHGQMAQKFDEGVAKGTAEGKLKEKKDIALKMLQQGIQIKMIEQFTGLSSNEIKELKTTIL